jgi:ABC-type transport system involved in cytochrome bd biosynthesis fused ATPase/permease subunit
MNVDLRRLLRWLRRARPPALDLFRAIVAGSVASITSVGLLVGAVGLLVASARRPGLGAVAGVLIIIEVLAFLRSPLRFFERVSAHRLGFQAVTRWRRWLVATVGRWDYSRWRVHAAGDLLERSLSDTDELQDLWLRFALPVINTAVTMLLGDVVVALLAPHGEWLATALWFFVIQVAGVALLVTSFGPLVRADRALRLARGSYQACLVELSTIVPELALLHREEFASSRLDQRREVLAGAESAVHRVQRRSIVLSLVAGLLAIQALWLSRPHASPTWLVVTALVGVATFDALATIRLALNTAVAVSGSSERLEDLDESPFHAQAAWPVDATIEGSHLSLREDSSTLLTDANFTFAPGKRVAIVGPSGEGKSTLLRALGGLDPVWSGELRIGGVPVRDIDEPQLRHMLSYLASEPGLTRGYARDVLRLGRSSERESHVDLAQLGVDSEESSRFEDLSRGERQRIAIVRALVTDPHVIIADEPTSGLGADETDRVLDLLATTNATVVVATHDERVVRWCDEVYELTNAQLRQLSR